MQGSLFANARRLGVSLANAPPVNKLQGMFNQIGLLIGRGVSEVKSRLSSCSNKGIRWVVSHGIPHCFHQFFDSIPCRQLLR